VPGWNLEWSSKWGRWYWWHTGTRETSWIDPTAAEEEEEREEEGEEDEDETIADRTRKRRRRG
jgi:hypothetical protein